MHRWERRLKDLSIQLETCCNSYFNPELFRMNANTFLTSARTITFLVQKEKTNIPDYENWYQNHVLNPWSIDPIMSWAKESRNMVEKEGDLSLYSELAVSLIYTHLEETDIIVKCEKEDVVRANVATLLRYAESRLPKWVAEDAVVKIERKWVANTLPQMELIQIFTYIYSQNYFVCSKLASHLGEKLNDSIGQPSDFNNFILGERKITYIKYSDRRVSSFKSIRQRRDPAFKPPLELQTSLDEFQRQGQATSLSENVHKFSINAKAVFEHFGYHIPMLMLFDDKFSPIDLSSVRLDDRATKYLFWRSAADKIAYLGASSFIWISEYWKRSGDITHNPAWKNFPVNGEGLHVIGMNKQGEISEICWDIVRSSDDSVSLCPVHAIFSEDNKIPNFLIPVVNALKRAQTKAIQ